MTPEGKMIFDYRLNFKKIIPLKEYKKWKGRAFKKVKNNRFSPIYGGGLLDDCYKINKDTLILKAYKISKRSGKKKTFAYDIIFRTLF